MVERLDIKIGDILWIKYSNGNNENHIQTGIRPGIVIQNNRGNYYSPTIQVIPLTTKMNKAKMPTHALVPSNDITKLPKISIALCEGAQLISKTDIIGKIGKVDDQTMKNIARCWLINNPLLIFFKEGELTKLKNELINRNIAA